jgi:ketoreductase RED2
MGTDKVALVTGGTAGIGAATVRALAAKGYRVAFSSSRTAAEGEELARSLGGSLAYYRQADVADARGSEELVNSVLEHFGRLDLLVNNAATTKVIAHNDLEGASDEVWRLLFEVNVLGTFRMIRLCAPHLKTAGQGCVINVASLAGTRPQGSSVPYATTKAAVVHITKLLAKALAPEVRVNGVAPGLVETRWTQTWDQVKEAWLKRAPLGPSAGLVQPDDVAEAICWLAEARQVTGEIVHVDGGMALL